MGILSQLVHFRYNAEYVLTQSDTVGGANQEVPPAHPVRQKCLLSGMPQQADRQIPTAVSVQEMPPAFFASLPYLAQGYEDSFAEVLADPMVLDNASPGTAGFSARLYFGAGSTTLV